MSGNKLSEFIDVTHASESDAHSYLTQANDDLALAIATYFAAQPSAGESPRDAQSSQPNSRHNSRSMSRSSASSSRSSLHRAPRHRFATFSDLAREQEGLAPLSQANADDPQQQFFTGGERSGLAVTNPNDRRSTGGSRSRAPSSFGQSDTSNLVDQIIRKAQDRAAAPDADAEDGDLPSQQQQQVHFKGRGFRLGSEGDDEQALVDEDEDEDEEDEDQPVLQRTMYFWRDGFSIDDGPLYRFDDPQNAVYLRAINMGRAPIELLKVRPHQPVDVKLVQRPDEDYVKPKVAPTLDNAGPGQRLGSATTGFISQQQQQTASSSSSSSAQQSDRESSVKPRNGLGEQGDAAVQLRLADGSARRLRFQGQGPVQQLYDYADSVNPIGRPYVLQTPLPCRTLDDKQQSLESAGVAGAVVVQRWL